MSLFYLYIMCASACECGEGIRSVGSVVTGGSELPDVGAGN